MARIRTIKPEFWTDPTIVGLSTHARLLYIGMWNFADDYGCVEDEPMRLKLQILPADNVEISALVDELVATGRVRRLVSADGEPFLHVRSWERHQKVDKRSRPRFGDPETWSEPHHDPPPPPDPAEPPRVPPSPRPGREGKGRDLEGKVDVVDASSSSTAATREREDDDDPAAPDPQTGSLTVRVLAQATREGANPPEEPSSAVTRFCLRRLERQRGGIVPSDQAARLLGEYAHCDPGRLRGLLDEHAPRTVLDALVLAVEHSAKDPPAYAARVLRERREAG